MGTSTITFTSHPGLLTQQAPKPAQLYFHGLLLPSPINSSIVTKQALHETSFVTHDFSLSLTSNLQAANYLHLFHLRVPLLSTPPFHPHSLGWASHHLSLWEGGRLLHVSFHEGTKNVSRPHAVCRGTFPRPSKALTEPCPSRTWPCLAFLPSFLPVTSRVPDFWMSSAAIASLSFCSSALSRIVLTLFPSLLKSYSSLNAQCKY